MALALLLVGATTAGAQTSRADPIDFHTRYGAVVTFDLPNGWETQVEYELRLIENSSRYRGSYITGELSYELVDWLTMIGGYRLGLVDEGTFHRYTLGAQGEADLGELDLSLRTLYQLQTQTFDEEQATDSDFLLRTRLRAEYPLAEPLDLYASTEPYFTFASDEYPIDNIRNTVGFQLEYLDGKSVDLYYIYRPDFAKSYNRTFHTLGVNFEFEVDPF